MRQRVQMAAGARPDDRSERLLRHRGHVGDGAHTTLVELRPGDRTDAPEALDGQRVKELEFTVGLDDQQSVGLADAARHLGQEFRSGDTDRDRQTDLGGHALAKPLGDLTRACRRSARDRSTSMNASSIDMPSTSGDVSLKMAYTALLASTYASKRAGTSIRFGHSRRACDPDIAERTPNRFAS